jgi:hypothetical protein
MVITWQGQPMTEQHGTSLSLLYKNLTMDIIVFNILLKSFRCCSVHAYSSSDYDALATHADTGNGAESTGIPL